MILNLILAISTSSLAAPVGITAGMGVIFWAGLALFREVRRVNKADTLMDAYIARVEADNERLRQERENLEHKVHERDDQFEKFLEHLTKDKK